MMPPEREFPPNPPNRTPKPGPHFPPQPLDPHSRIQPEIRKAWPADFATPRSNEPDTVSLSPITLFALRRRFYFAWDLCRMVKRIEQDEKNPSLCSHLKFKYATLCELFLQRNQSDFILSHVNISRGSKIFTKWLPHSFIRPKRR